MDRFPYTRRFGTEIEINSFDGIAKNTEKAYPVGSHYASVLIADVVKDRVELNTYHHTDNNMYWTVKSDSSCGIEICSPVLKGMYGIRENAAVAEALYAGGLHSDDRCSFHVHVEIADLNMDQIANIIRWWIKCEAVFLDAMPANRKNSKYCQVIGVTDFIHHNATCSSQQLVSIFGNNKYWTLSYPTAKGNVNRKTLEFRILDNTACLNPEDIFNWLQLVIHFVEVTKDNNSDKKYTKNNVFSGFSWLDPDDVFTFLKLYSCEYMVDVGKWFLNRIKNNINDNKFKVGKPSWMWQGGLRSLAERQLPLIESKLYK